MTYNANTRWTDQQNLQLLQHLSSRTKIDSIAEQLGRSRLAILQQVGKLYDGVAEWVNVIALTADTRLSNFRNVDVLFAQRIAIKQLDVKHSTIYPNLRTDQDQSMP